MNKKKVFRFALFFMAAGLQINAGTAFCQSVKRDIKTEEYKRAQHSMSRGWNTWYNNSVLSHVLLPAGFSINLCFTRPGSNTLLRETFKASAAQKRPETVVLGLRSDDGYYTSLNLVYNGEELEVQTATEGNEQLILVSPVKGSENYLIVEPGILWNRQGRVGVSENMLEYTGADTTVQVHMTADPVSDAYALSTSPHLTYSLVHEMGIYTGRKRSLDELKSVIQQHREVQQKRIAAYGVNAESFKAMQTILAWNTIYDAPNDRVITPVSRLWSNGWGGFVLFDWDTYFASLMLSMFNKDLAYANAIEITKAITPAGFIPNYQSTFGNTSWDRSQPPIGSTVILNIYKKYQEQWFLKEVYEELLTWNRWWPKNRDRNGYLCWGSDSVEKSSYGMHNLQAAKYESGLDNSPMYDDVPFNRRTNTMELADVGLMSMYIMDCNSLSEMASILGKKEDAIELKKRGDSYRKKLATLWDEKAGIFLNLRLDKGEKSRRLSPTNFYPMLARACTEKQAERMVREHYFNKNEFYGTYIMPSIARNDPGFKDNDYWRGRIWGPMNFLVYMGMRNYKVGTARADLIAKSNALLLQNWNADGGVYENYNSVNGKGSDVGNADGFYHWGALLSFMSFWENGSLDPVKK